MEQNPVDEYMQTVIDKIGQYGWMVQGVLGTDDAPPWSYTVGLWHSYRHPEVCVLGLPGEFAHKLLNKIGDWVSAGETFEVGIPYDDILKAREQKLECQFVNVNSSAHRLYFTVASAFYHGRLRYRVRQLVWPDPENHLPMISSPTQPLLDRAERN